MKYINPTIKETILQLQKELGQDIIFTGSVEDVAHLGCAIKEVGDLDIIVPFTKLNLIKSLYNITCKGPSYYNWFLEKEDKIRYEAEVNGIKIDFFVYTDQERQDRLYKHNAEGLTIYTRGKDFKIDALNTMLKNGSSIELEWFLNKFNEIKKLYDNANTTYLDFSG